MSRGAVRALAAGVLVLGGAGASAQPAAGGGPAGAATAVVTANEGSAGSAIATVADVQIDRVLSWGTSPFDGAPAFVGTPSRKLSASLVVDAGKDDVDARLRPLEHMAGVDRALGRPPVVTFAVGALVFHGVVETMSIRYSGLQPDGRKTHADVKLQLREADAAAAPFQAMWDPGF